MPRVFFVLLPLTALIGCESRRKPQTTTQTGVQTSNAAGSASGTHSLNTAGAAKGSLADARRGFQTQLHTKTGGKDPAPPPPRELFQLVRYESPAGKLAAYVSNSPNDGKLHPAMIWIFGGFDNDIDDTAWAEAPASNDQSAGALRKAGIMMMFPSRRGGNDGLGFKEGLFGEVDDVLAAADYLAKQEFIDPKRIYLGGHSTGGTLVLLAAECSDRFRAVFSFGPVGEIAGYFGQVPFNFFDSREAELRSPKRWLAGIHSPVFVFEGSEQGNLSSLQDMAKVNTNPQVHFHPVQGATHFSVLSPTNKLIASKIIHDDGAAPNISFSQEEIRRLTAQ